MYNAISSLVAKKLSLFFRHQILVCTTISMFFVAGLSVAVVVLNFGMTSLGYVFPLLCLGEAIFMLLYLCIKVPEVSSSKCAL